MLLATGTEMTPEATVEVKTSTLLTNIHNQFDSFHFRELKKSP